MKLLLSALVGISVIELGTGNNMLEGLAPSPSPSLSLSPTLSPAPSTGPVEGFTYIGTGWCLDSKDASYASIELVLNDANNNDCMKRCSQVQHPDFVGVSARDYGDGTRACFCGFSGGLPGEGDVNGAGYGVGPVQRSDGTSDISCYRYDNFTGCFPLTKKVKVQSLTGVPIQMFELQVISTGLNVAVGKDATQSSDFKGKAMFAASKAVDDKVNSFSHTGRSECGVWWEVDLGDSFPIESIKILNRYCEDKSDQHGCLCRLSHAAILLLGDDGKWVDAVLTGNTCGVLEVEHVFEPSSDYCA